MLQDIRKSSQGTGAKIIVGIIVIAFAGFGVEQILLGGGSDGIAEVNGEEISAGELQQAVYLEQRRLMSQMGDNIDPAMLEDDRLRAPAMEGLINRKVLVQAADAMGLTISEAEIGRLVGEMAQFQVDGRFSPELYKQVLSENGYTPNYFKAALRDDMVVNQVRNGLAASDFATPAELDVSARIVAEQRDFRYLTIPRDRFSSAEGASDEDIVAYYEENKDRFLSEESVDVEFIELDAERYREPVAEADVLDAYEQALLDFDTSDEHRVSHILVEGDDEEARARIQEIRTALDGGADFAELAAQYSDDPGSAGRGGDLGYTSGDAFPAEMEEVIASLAVGDVSLPVRTDAGTHLVLVTERREGVVPTLDELRAELEASLQQEAARAALLVAVEELRDVSFNAEDLSSPAAELELEIQRIDGVTRFHGEGPFTAAPLRDAAFSDNVLNAGYNSEVIELPGDRFAVVRVRTHNPPVPRPLVELRGEISAVLEEAATTAAVADAAQDTLAQLAAGRPMDEIAAEGDFPWQVELAADRGNFNVPPEVLRRVFELPAPGAEDAVREYVVTGAGDAVVVELSRVHPGSLEALQAADRDQLRDQVRAEYAGLVDAEYRRGQRSSAEIVAN